MRLPRSRLLVLLLTVLLFSASCTRVRFNQKELLGDDMMVFDHDEMGSDLQNHVLTPREGSIGGFSSVGAGGCGCN